MKPAYILQILHAENVINLNLVLLLLSSPLSMHTRNRWPFLFPLVFHKIVDCSRFSLYFGRSSSYYFFLYRPKMSILHLSYVHVRSTFIVTQIGLQTVVVFDDRLTRWDPHSFENSFNDEFDVFDLIWKWTFIFELALQTVMIYCVASVHSRNLYLCAKQCRRKQAKKTYFSFARSDSSLSAKPKCSE